VAQFGGPAEFNPYDFAASQETIYILSKEGAGSAAPLTTALTVAIAEAMEERAERSGGRLPLPALFALDELANAVRWAGLPDQFSHYGSKDLIVMGILQSWSQGVELWGEANMRKIWSAANVKVYGGGVAEEGFLRALSDLIGDYSYTNVSIPSWKSGSSRSRQEGKERILDVSNLAELDRGPRRRSVSWLTPSSKSLHAVSFFDVCAAVVTEPAPTITGMPITATTNVSELNPMSIYAYTGTQRFRACCGGCLFCS
jgi:hypothetical protein